MNHFLAYVYGIKKEDALSDFFSSIYTRKYIFISLKIILWPMM